MSVDPRAGTLPEESDLVDVDKLVGAYHDRPDPANRVAFGTSGHRGTSLAGTFTEWHVAAISEAVCRYREAQGIDGPLFLGADTHALSAPAVETIVEVLVAHGVDVCVDAHGGATPTPVISHSILEYNRGGNRGTADGIVVTPSHNPPGDGGFKYNPPHGGPADTDATGWIEREANALLDAELDGVLRVPYSHAQQADSLHRRDYVHAYVAGLSQVIDLDAIRESGLRLGVDPLGGASAAYWAAIAEVHGLDLEIVNDEVDPTFRFVPLDWDGKIRMDCSSPYAMARLTEMRDRFDVAFANDPDADRHGIVTPAAGLLNPNHHLAACVAYLFGGHRDWGEEVGIGKTLVSSSIIDRAASELGRRLVEVPVGFKWFVEGLARRHARVRRRGERGRLVPAPRRTALEHRQGRPDPVPAGRRDEGDAPARTPARSTPSWPTVTATPPTSGSTSPPRPEDKDTLKKLSPEQVTSEELAGEPILDKLTAAPGNGAPIGGLKVVAEHGWFAARPSGTEDVYKVYAEGLDGEERLERILDEAQQIVDQALRG